MTTRTRVKTFLDPQKLKDLARVRPKYKTPKANLPLETLPNSKID
jgi:hypothetical protein